MNRKKDHLKQKFKIQNHLKTFLFFFYMVNPSPLNHGYVFIKGLLIKEI